MYSLVDYQTMIADPARIDAYNAAMRQAIWPGCVCLDIGTGTGFFAVLACQLGARKVIAIEPDDIIQVAREVAAANGFAKRITFIQDHSTRVHLDERADVIIADLRGALPLLGQHLPNLADARRRLLAPGGTLIPHKDTMWAAPVEASEQYARTVPLCDQPVKGVKLEVTRSRLVNSWRKTRMQPENLLAAPRQWACIDYANVEGPNVRGEAAWTIERPGMGHGLLLWFEASLLEGIGFSTAPGQLEQTYGQGFFPWVQPVPLAAGDIVEVSLRADLIGVNYVWRWNSTVRALGPGGPVKADYRQSSFFGAKLPTPNQLRKRAAEYRVELTEDGQIDRLILSYMDPGARLADIARKVAEQFPHNFPTWQDALTRVGDLAVQYSR